MAIKTLRLILGDQLNEQHSWFQEKSDNIIYVLMEVEDEASYVKHHIQKVLAFFAAMRNFKDSLIKKGHKVQYLTLDDPKNFQSFSKNLKKIIEKEKIEKFEYQLADEYRLDQELQNICQSIEIPSQAFDSEHFYTERYEMKEFFEKKKSKQWLMESFYRQMRKKHNILLQEDQSPLGGNWNYDKSNRKALPKNHNVIKPLVFDNDVQSLYEMIQKKGINSIGEVNATEFKWPVNREQSLDLLDFFVKKCLPLFGDFQDAMSNGEWSLYHSRLSFSMNCKILSPKEVINAVLTHWDANQDSIDISQVEGFIRQILGWREYMRGIYWAKMPQYESENQLNHQRALPNFYWTGNTKMNCMQKAIDQSLKHAYAHHIQRLMITGNFALLANCNPMEVDEWYLGIYIDAIQWVELPNTRGMSQYADGGLIATKPYVSSANYIDKMGDHCKKCHYSKSKKTGEKACPFNSLYWNFIDQHIDLWTKNQRMSMMVASWKKRKPEEKIELLKQAEYYLENINSL